MTRDLSPVAKLISRSRCCHHKNQFNTLHKCNWSPIRERERESERERRKGKMECNVLHINHIDLIYCGLWSWAWRNSPWSVKLPLSLLRTQIVILLVKSVHTPRTMPSTKYNRLVAASAAVLSVCHLSLRLSAFDYGCSQHLENKLVRHALLNIARSICVYGKYVGENL